MAENATLKAALRDEQGKSAARRMRREGRIPAVIYGRGEETRSLSLDAHEFEMLVKRYSLDTTLIELSIEGARKKAGSVKALVSEVQRHPYRPQVLHVDFQQIHAGETVTVEVPIRLVGTAEGVRAGGVLQHVLHELELECAVEVIPEAIEVDVSGLEIGDSVHVAELNLPEGVEVLVDADRTVCTVAAPTVLEVPEPEEAAVAEPELVGAEGEEAEGGEGEGEDEAGAEGGEG
ncbi:MAG TPA: 50S ribosomal protein L25/general stress protein Ctc [Longimicrobiales bacterium]|nr:50S ribosomal protein L25/general stress protein Ctc [Longimicrobiales bacterium]